MSKSKCLMSNQAQNPNVKKINLPASSISGHSAQAGHLSFQTKIIRSHSYHSDACLPVGRYS